MSRTNTGETDTALWNRFRQGDRESFGQIYNLYIEELLSYGYRVTSNRQLIKDSIQDLFLHMWTHRENLSETDSVKFYLFRSLRNRIIRNLESQRELPSTLSDSIEDLLADFPVENTLMENEIYQEQVQKLQSAISHLPKRQQEVIQLRYHHNFSLEEIANVMQINNQSVRNLLHRSIIQLRSFFEMAGWIFFLFFLR